MTDTGVTPSGEGHSDERGGIPNLHSLGMTAAEISDEISAIDFYHRFYSDDPVALAEALARLAAKQARRLERRARWWRLLHRLGFDTPAVI